MNFSISVVKRCKTFIRNLLLQEHFIHLDFDIVRRAGWLNGFRCGSHLSGQCRLLLRLALLTRRLGHRRTHTARAKLHGAIAAAFAGVAFAFEHRVGRAGLLSPPGIRTDLTPNSLFRRTEFEGACGMRALRITTASVAGHLEGLTWLTVASHFAFVRRAAHPGARPKAIRTEAGVAVLLLLFARVARLFALAAVARHTGAGPGPLHAGAHVAVHRHHLAFLGGRASGGRYSLFFQLETQLLGAPEIRSVLIALARVALVSVQELRARIAHIFGGAGSADHDHQQGQP